MKKFDASKLRQWQQKCVQSEAATEFLSTANRKRLVLDVFPGCGKSILGAVIASKLREAGAIDHIVVFSPTCSVAAQWGNDARRGEPKMPVLSFVNQAIQMQGSIKSRQMKYPPGIMGHSTTFSALSFSMEKHRDMIGARTLVILDEAHHLSDGDSVWGEAARYACEEAGKVLVLSGTLYRHSKTRIPFVEYDTEGLAIADYKFEYKEAVGSLDGFSPCIRRPEFHMFDGNGEYIYTDDPGNPQRIESFANARPDEYAVCKALFLGGAGIEDCIKSAVDKWQKYKMHDPNASMLIAANDIKHASDLKMFVESFVNQRVFYVVSEDPADNKTDTVDDFRQSRGSIAVAVRQIAEGVDVPDIRVVVHATNYTTQQFNTQLWFRAGRNRTHADGRDDYAHGCGSFAVFVIDLPGIRKCVQDLVDGIPPAYVPPPDDPPPTGPGPSGPDRVVLSSEAQKNTIADYSAEHIEVLLSDVREATVVHYMGDMGYSLSADMKATTYESIIKKHGEPSRGQVVEWMSQQQAAQAAAVSKNEDTRTLAEQCKVVRDRADRLSKQAAGLYRALHGVDYGQAIAKVKSIAKKEAHINGELVEAGLDKLKAYERSLEYQIKNCKVALAGNRRASSCTS